MLLQVSVGLGSAHRLENTAEGQEDTPRCRMLATALDTVLHHSSEEEHGSSLEDEKEATPKNAARTQRALRHSNSASEQAAASQVAV